MVASDTLPTDMVLVRRMGVSSRPHSTTWVRPETSPAPLSTKAPASTLSAKMGSGGRMAVTPVRTGPLPTTSGPSPRMSVVWPTRTPGTSVIALSDPVGRCPMAKPSSRSRRLTSHLFHTEGTEDTEQEEAEHWLPPLCALCSLW